MPITVEGPDGSTASFPDGTAPDVMRRAMRSKFGGGGQGGAIRDSYKIPSNQPQSFSPPPATGGDDLAYRGAMLPFGKTKEGKIVPALPQALHTGAEVTKRIMGGGADPTPAELLEMGSLGVGGEISGAVKGVRPSVPTTAELGAAKTGAYAAAKAAGVVIKPDAFKGMVESLVPELREAAFDPGLHPKVGAVMQRLAAEAGQGTPKSLNDLDLLRRVARSAAGSQDKDERRIAQIIIGKIDEFTDRLSPENTLGGDTEQGVASLKQARELALRNAKSDEIEGMIDKALTKAGQYSASGRENALRDQFKKLADSEPRMRRYTAEEQEAIKDAARTGKLQKGLVNLGKLSPTAGAFGMLISGGEFATGAYLHDPRLLALPLGGLIARHAATKMREKAVENVGELVRGGRPISDYRVQQNLRKSKDARKMSQFGAFGPGAAGGMVPDDNFNPLVNPNQT